MSPAPAAASTDMADYYRRRAAYYEHVYHNVFLHNGISPLSAGDLRYTFGMVFDNVGYGVVPQCWVTPDQEPSPCAVPAWMQRYSISPATASHCAWPRVWLRR